MEGRAGKTVTCTERVRMNMLAGLLFMVAGYGIVAVAFLSDRSGTIGATITTICGFAGVIFGFYYLLCYFNKSITVSDNGVVYVNWMSRRKNCTWDQVNVSYHLGRNAYFTFELDGKKVTFYGYARNAQELYDYLLEHERFDDDTMRTIRNAQEKEAERIREMQKRAREAAANDGDDD